MKGIIKVVTSNVQPCAETFNALAQLHQWEVCVCAEIMLPAAADAAQTVDFANSHGAALASTLLALSCKAQSHHPIHSLKPSRLEAGEGPSL